jgi:hypothetical protein
MTRTEQDLRDGLSMLEPGIGAKDQIEAFARELASRPSPPIRPFARLRRLAPMVALPAAALATAVVVLAAAALAPDGGDGSPQTGATAETLAPPQDSGISWRWLFSIDSPPAGWRQLNEIIRADHQEAALVGPTGAVCTIQVFAPGAYDTSRIGADTTPVTVNGTEGAFASTANLSKEAVPAVSWQYAPGAYAVSFCPQDSVDVRSDALTVASALTARQRPFTMPFEVGYLPAGQVPDEAFSQTDQARYARGFLGVTGLSTGISLTTGEADPRNLDGAQVLTVSTLNGPRDAAFREGMLMVFYDGFQVWIGLASPTVSRDELIRIAENLTIAPNPADPSTWFDARHALP